MNYLILTDRYFPTPVSGAILMKDLVTQLQLEGHNITVLSASSEIRDEYNFESSNNINILRVKTENQKNLSYPKRLMFELFLQRKIWKIYQLKQLTSPDYIIAQSPTIFWSFIIKKLKQKKDIPFYLILRDIFPKWVVDTGIISKFNPVYLFLKLHEKKLYKLADVIGVQSESNLQYFSRKKTANRIEVLYNFKKLDSKVTRKNDLRSKLNLHEKVIFVFGGNLGFAQDPNNLLMLVNSLKSNKKAHFLFIGEGTEFENLLKERDSQQLDNLSLIPSVSDKEYQSILLDCDIGLISLRKDFQTDNFPNKLLNYMQYELPVLASINPGNELIQLIGSCKNGLVSENGNDEDFIMNAKILLESRNLRKDMGKRGKDLLYNQFDVRSATMAIETSLNSL
jgi:glycosyltransferase involved in cell wall biosynthesis